MRINWRVRMRNPYFWFGLVGIVLAALGIEPEMFTSWAVLVEQVRAFLGNPFAIWCVVVAVVGYVNDPTTKGIGDSRQALGYRKPRKD